MLCGSAFSVKNYLLSDEFDECYVSGCGNKTNRRNKILLYPFPENKNRRQQWINTLNIVSVNRPTQEADDLKVCSQYYLLIQVNYLKHLYLIPGLSNIFRLVTHEKVVDRRLQYVSYYIR